MSTPIKQELGNKYGRLTVIELAGQANRGGHALWKCSCACGGEIIAYGSNLRKGHTTSCGCFLAQKITKHGASRRSGHQPEYGVFQSAKERCRNPNNQGYANYGGRGIKFLFRDFLHFMAVLGPRPTPKHSLDRYPNNDGNYEPGNCRWATPKEQNANQRKRLRLDQWSDRELLSECSRRGLL